MSSHQSAPKRVEKVVALPRLVDIPVVAASPGPGPSPRSRSKTRGIVGESGVDMNCIRFGSSSGDAVASYISEINGSSRPYRVSGSAFITRLGGGKVLGKDEVVLYTDQNWGARNVKTALAGGFGAFRRFKHGWRNQVSRDARGSRKNCLFLNSLYDLLFLLLSLKYLLELGGTSSFDQQARSWKQ
mmetsp:Transcript_8474/g.11996  ORF Transcript_8474/g.11996 Transcript_8474/m.11996 type:complete len:186 (-) Transcript_8474:185-742(-)